MKVIGIAGTAKNTGKTTTTSTLLDLLYNKNIITALTSIGYDGEDLDNVTGLPKPRYKLKPGMFIISSENCLNASTAKIETVGITNIRTPLGRIVIGKVIKDGLVVITGPNKSSELAQVISIVKNITGAEAFLVDGALNRIAPMVETQGIIIATGASRNINIPELVDDTQCLESIFERPHISEKDALDLTGFPIKQLLRQTRAMVFYKNNKSYKTDITSIFNKDALEPILITPSDDIKSIYIPGVIKYDFLLELAKVKKPETIIFRDPIKIILSGKPKDFANLVSKLDELNTDLLTVKSISIIAVTINPFYPAYQNKNKSYIPEYIDKFQLKQQMSDRLNSTVVNIVDEGAEAILAKVFNLNEGG
jgi:hypothetical protein